MGDIETERESGREGERARRRERERERERERTRARESSIGRGRKTWGEKIWGNFEDRREHRETLRYNGIH